MEYPSDMMPYPPPGDRMEGHHPRHATAFNHHKPRGAKSSSYIHPKKHHRNPSHGGLSEMICMNCGSLEHWDHHCPEASRGSHPGGPMQPPPPKRQKMHRGSGQFRGDSQFHRHPQAPHEYPYPHPRIDYDHMPMDHQYGPPMSNPQHPPPYGRWQQGPPRRDYYGYPSYGPPDAPPMSSYGSSYPGPRPYDQGYYPREYPPYPDEADYERFPPDHYQRPPPHEPYHQHQSKSLKRRSGPWMDERRPQDSHHEAKPDNQIVWRPPVQVARPLPSFYEDLDEMSKLPPAGSLPRGMTVSKYILDRPPEDFLCNIRETEDWPFVMSDPIFLKIPLDSKMITMEELIARRNKIYETHKVPVKSNVDDNEDQSEMEPAEELDDEQKYYDGSETGSKVFSPGHEPRSPGFESRSSRYESRSPDDELRSPRMSRGPSPAKSERSEANSGALRLSDIASPEGEAGDYDDRKLRHMDRSDQPQYDPNGFPSNHEPSFDPHFNQMTKFGPSYQRHAKSQAFNGQGPKYKPRNGFVAAKVSLPDSAFEGHDKVNIKRETPEDQAIHWPRRSEDQTDRDRRNHPKKEMSPASSNGEPRRQEDNVTPRFKRRQPRVAEAYSRRW